MAKMKLFLRKETVTGLKILILHRFISVYDDFIDKAPVFCVLRGHKIIPSSAASIAFNF